MLSKLKDSNILFPTGQINDQHWLDSNVALDKVCVYLFFSKLYASVVNMFRSIMSGHVMHSDVIYHEHNVDFISLTMNRIISYH